MDGSGSGIIKGTILASACRDRERPFSCADAPSWNETEAAICTDLFIEFLYGRTRKRNKICSAGNYEGTCFLWVHLDGILAGLENKEMNGKTDMTQHPGHFTIYTSCRSKLTHSVLRNT
jgi:hypothetical protein